MQENNAALNIICKDIRQINERLEGNDKRFEKIDQRFEKIDQRFEKIDQRFEKIDQRFEKIDQRFDKIDQRLDVEFRIVHSSINAIAVDLYKKRIEDDQKHADLKAMFDTFLHLTDSSMRVSAVEKTIDEHDQRISKLEFAA